MPQKQKPTVEPDYIYLQAWFRLMGNHYTVIATHVAVARREKAPETAIYKDVQTGKWALFEDVKNVDARSRTEMWANVVREEIKKQYGETDNRSSGNKERKRIRIKPE